MVTIVKTKTSNIHNNVNNSQKEGKTIYSFYKKINTDTATINHERDNIIQDKELDTGIGAQSFSEDECVVENVIISSDININININILPVKINTNTNMLLPIQCQNNRGTNNSDFLKNSTPWVEKYRPSCFEDIVLDPLNKTLLKNIIDNNYFPNLLFYGPPGTGKTTTIINLVNVYQEKMNLKNKGLMIHLNASDERGIDIIRNQINSFVNS